MITKIGKLCDNCTFLLNLWHKKQKPITLNAEITACFTGHRTYDGSRNDELRTAICRLYSMGYRYFLCGMATGFDLEAAEMVISLRNRLPLSEVIAVVPFKGMEERFPAEQRARYQRVIAEAEEVITLATHYSPGVYTQRNNFMVKNSSAVITYFTGEKGGTAYTIHQAVKHLCYIQNIYNNPQQEFAF